MNRRAITLCAALVLAGCKSAPAPVAMQSAPQPAATNIQPVCPPFRAWSDADMKSLAAALAPVPADSIIIRMALDWRRYYGDAKACDGARK